MESGESPKKRSALQRQAILLAAVAVSVLVVTPVAWWLGQTPGATAAAVAAAACWAGAALGMALGDLLASEKAAVAGWLLGMIPRMGFPLGLAIVARVAGGPLSEAGMLYYLLIFYPLVLAVEAILALPRRDEKPL